MMTTPTNSSFPAHAIVACPGGPRITTYVGRKDSTNPAPGGLLPDVHASGDSLFALFADKCFSAVDLAALFGAHSTSKQFNTDTSNAALLHQRQQLRRNVLETVVLWPVGLGCEDQTAITAARIALRLVPRAAVVEGLADSRARRHCTAPSQCPVIWSSGRW